MGPGDGSLEPSQSSDMWSSESTLGLLEDHNLIPEIGIRCVIRDYSRHVKVPVYMFRGAVNTSRRRDDSRFPPQIKAFPAVCLSVCLRCLRSLRARPAHAPPAPFRMRLVVEKSRRLKKAIVAFISLYNDRQLATKSQVKRADAPNGNVCPQWEHTQLHSHASSVDDGRVVPHCDRSGRSQFGAAARKLTDVRPRGEVFIGELGVENLDTFGSHRGDINVRMTLGKTVSVLSKRIHFSDLTELNLIRTN
ncbi:hypothetical protein EVAR_69501_1 [Eumeta japonica]|uniref:Uncharacterized protein n=1 Tax=Eumeta variegata TaxID=151549 RepID=A0A4C2AI35_EUMVA|nr:hypothetical protein EVAR_69501_1 [Eumeta japonica]